MAEKLILSPTEAAAYARYLTGFASSMSGSSKVYLGLGNVSGATFTEITPNTANNYARVLVKVTGADIPDLLTQSDRTVKNHEQIVFNKVLSAGYTANAIGLFRAETGGSAYAWAKLTTSLDAVVGSLPMFERNQLDLTIPDGTETD